MERVFYAYNALIELTVVKLTMKGGDMLLQSYEEFCDNEYHKIGEMKGMRGFWDYLKLRKEGKEELMLVKAKDDFVKESHS